eukprot:12902281-Ditylum_brightwellii.AAC.1
MAGYLAQKNEKEMLSPLGFLLARKTALVDWDVDGDKEGENVGDDVGTFVGPIVGTLGGNVKC